MRSYHQKALGCLEFVLSDNERHGFAASQLLHYHLDVNPSTDPDAPPQRLVLGFATGDVILVGWRLGRSANNLRDGELLAIRSLAT